MSTLAILIFADIFNNIHTIRRFEIGFVIQTISNGLAFAFETYSFFLVLISSTGSCTIRGQLSMDNDICLFGGQFFCEYCPAS
ncbi:hypothetical protein BpHYR1_043663 [Brachionus plicatilis]|uniref:Uncharacterized protein n=1 Tax=Brachionus plicatilis TaxID=10195 RepID=A0A3M7PFI6_BRAPC|nr:hypothetical protein BpHYR1_043663 [Brachionus plicatilis]